MIQKTSQTDLEKLYQSREAFSHELSKNIHMYGITQSIGRLYGTVLFADEPMTLDDMSQAVGMSKTSMSTGIRTLLEANMVDRGWQKGVRKDLYQPEMDWYKSFSTVFVKRWKNSVDNNLKAVEKHENLLTQLVDTEDEHLKAMILSDLNKMSHARKYYQWLQEVIQLFESEEIYNIVPKKD
ncbi:GbsR/MarR family transcriptional regulator [Alkalihalobacillus trypoxylicola]|uniref:HTH-type transcriptional regulator n=1 Tax=Alkalihalobacillus trypoxylicola TaxID=519424 RepID=A0A161P466_9BACI|nr:transcriptional regulator [Alkalihalobacillus trypoxylicola]KYG26615.1 transcriptional regulator [Alkalihalobacillus trypoxylicola]GAF64199.1 putative transcriptional regulator [Bacillus sp. TS-2]